MAAITTAAAGNWSATGTWTGGVVPGNGDTVTLNHAVTVNVDTVVGHSPGEADAVRAISGTVNGNITIAAGVTMTVRGDWNHNGDLIMQEGSRIVIDSSLSAAPATTAYNIKYSTVGGAAGFCSIAINGTATSRCKIETAPGCKHGAFLGTFNNLQYWSESYCDWTRMGNTPTAICIDYKFLGASAVKRVDVVGSRYINMNGRVSVGANDTSCSEISFNFDKIEWVDPASTLSICMYINDRAKAGSATRKLTNSRVPLEVLWGTAGGAQGWDFSGSVLSKLNGPPGAPEGDCVGTDVILLDSDGSPRVTLASTNTKFTNLFLFGHNAHPDHQEGIHRPWGAELENVIWEVGSSHTEHRVAVCGATDASIHPTNPGNIRPIKIKKWLARPNPRGEGPGFFMMMKGIKSHRIEMENGTFPMPADNEFWHGAAKTSWGSNSRAYPDYITAYRNNLHWQPVPNLAAQSWGINQLRTESNRTGTAGAGSTASVINASLLLSGTVPGSSTGEGVYQVKMTSGPDIGLIRPVVANTTTTITVDPPFPNATAGYTINVFPLDSVSDVTNNAFFKCPANGTIYNANNDAARTNVVGYDGLVQTDYDAIGANDLVRSDSLTFVDATRSIYTWATAADGLNHSLAPAWVDATSYTYGDRVSRAGGATYFGNEALNWRCLLTHTSGTATAPGGYANTWQKTWIPEGLFEMIQNKLGRTGFDEDATQANYFAWMTEGFTPTNEVLRDAGYDGEDIGFAPLQGVADITAPNLTDASCTATSPTTATGVVTTDDGNGTLYFLASANSTETAATIKAALSQAVTAAGEQTISLSGLDAETTYYLHFVQINGAALESDVVSTAAWTTPNVVVKGASLTLHAGVTPQASISNIVALWWDATTPSGAPAYSTTTASTDASGVLTLDLDATTALEIGGNGFLLLYKLDATDHEDSLVFAGRVAVSDIG